jgi:hypothetical protein
MWDAINLACLQIPRVLPCEHLQAPRRLHHPSWVLSTSSPRRDWVVLLVRRSCLHDAVIIISGSVLVDGVVVSRGVGGGAGQFLSAVLLGITSVNNHFPRPLSSGGVHLSMFIYCEAERWGRE